VLGQIDQGTLGFGKRNIPDNDQRYQRRAHPAGNQFEGNGFDIDSHASTPLQIQIDTGSD
jgi:hypothetical protein